MKYKLFFSIPCLIMGMIFTAHAQSVNTQLDPYWENYYNKNPTNIKTNYTAKDFIAIVDSVEFVPSSVNLKKNTALFKKGLNRIDIKSLQQMSVEGWYQARTKKHREYFFLYNRTYNPITEERWNRLCPYLIILMVFDELIKL